MLGYKVSPVNEFKFVVVGGRGEEGKGREGMVSCKVSWK